MANPLNFQPLRVDPKRELERRLAAAPTIHAEALLVLWDLLQTAHDKGVLDLLDGMIGAKDHLLDTCARYANTPEGIASIRNVLAAAKIIGAIDPELVDHLSRSVIEAEAERKRSTDSPSLWRIFRRATSEDSRRGLAYLTILLSGLGRSTK